MMMAERNYANYAAMMSALADPTRVEIFDMLSEGERCACNFLERFDLKQPTLSYHMKILCEAGLVDARKDGIWMKYTINQEALSSLQRFLLSIEASTKACEEC